MQVSGIGLKEKLEMAENGQVGIVNKKETVLFENHYQNAAVLEKNGTQSKEYKDTDELMKQTDEKSPAGLSQEMINQLVDNVTPEDYSAYAELGLAPESDDPSTLVTVNDRIKIELAAHCEDYSMYGTVDLEAIKSIYGDSGLAYSIASSLKEHNLPITQENIDAVKQAFEMADSIGNISEDSSSYILSNNLPITIENVYVSEHAKGVSENNQNDIELTEVQWNSLKPQVEQMLEKAGIEVTPENLADARWMIENKIPVTVENIQKMSAMKQFTNNMTEKEWIDSIVATIAFGGKGEDTLIIGIGNMEETAEEFVDVIENVTNEELQQIIKDNNTLNINNFKKYKEEEPEEQPKEQQEKQQWEPKEQSTGNEEQGNKDVSLIKARRQLEEIRLMMTSEAGVKMLMKGIDIDTEPIENIVNELKRQENEYASAIFNSVGYTPEEKDTDLFKSVLQSMEILKVTPSYVLGNVISGETEFEIEEVNKKGQEIKAKLEAAGEAYETMRTQPRKDLGDNINKAFESVDNILEDLETDVTESSRRAVRILAYNNMEITEENILSIKQLNMEVTRLIDNMTPKTTVHLISKGINPLNTDIKELNDMLEEVNREIGADYTEKYSEYLWKLQNDNAISEEDRKAYIGVYRLLNMVEKGDRSVIGALVNQGADITMNSMLRAVRSEKAKGIDIEVDKEMGFAEEIKFDENSVSNQLSGFMQNDGGGENPAEEQRYMYQMFKKILDEVTPQKLSEVSEHGNIFDMTLEELAENMEKYSEGRNEEYQMKYYEQCISDMQEMARNVSEEVFKMLLDSNQMPTIENVMAAAFVMSDKGRMFGRIKKLDEDKKIEDRVNKISEFDGDSEEIQQCYEALDNTMAGILDKYVMAGGTDNIDELIRLRKSFHLMNVMGQKEMYHIPIEINGETTGVRVTIVTNGSEKGKVTADIRSDVFGKISAEFNVRGNRVDGIIVADSDRTVRFLEGAMPELEKAFEDEGYITDGVNSSRHDNIGYGMWSMDGSKAEDVSNSSLYMVAKIFISNVKEWGKGLIINE